MFKSVVQHLCCIHRPLTTVVVLSLLVPSAILSCSDPRKSEPQNQNAEPVHFDNSSSIDATLPLKVGMTWDECVPLLKNAKRVTLVRQNADRFTDSYKISNVGYRLTFERPSQPEAGPYRLVKIEPADIKSEGGSGIDIAQKLKRGMPLNKALPLMQQVGGFFVLETKDRFVAVLQADDASFRVTFERPKGVSRPDVIANATPEVLRMSSRIPLNALPEFGEYRITTVKKTDLQ